MAAAGSTPSTNLRSPALMRNGDVPGALKVRSCNSTVYMPSVGNVNSARASPRREFCPQPIISGVPDGDLISTTGFAVPPNRFSSTSVTTRWPLVPVKKTNCCCPPDRLPKNAAGSIAGFSIELPIATCGNRSMDNATDLLIPDLDFTQSG